MPRVTYTASRQIEPTGLAVVNATDLSASTTDDSFNSVTTVLSGLTTGQWVYVAGFANAANNGWHQLAANSTATKITVSTNLVTEAAGPAVSVTGYKRGSGQQYSLDFDAAVIDPTDTDTKNRIITWGGRAESILLRQEREWLLRTLPLAAGVQAQWREFLASVAASEEFTLDPLGTLASPVDPFQAELLTSKHAPKRVGVSTYVTYEFRAREL